MRTLNKVLLASGSALLSGLIAGPALAQKDISPKLPNVLLLVDNSGSMEYLMKPAGKLPGDTSAPGTACNGTTNLSGRNRWASLVTALTGSIADGDFSCQAMPRTAGAFTSEFSLNGTQPYDTNYYLPFNRIYSNGCTWGAGKVPSGSWDWWDLPSDAGGKNYQMRNSSGNVSNCTFLQTQDGLLDAFKALVRFGMMTLDTLPDPGTGSTAVANPATARDDYPNGVKGMWSYYHNWLAGAPATPSIIKNMAANGVDLNTVRPASGYPAYCTTASFMEVGARNESAPPWEGRLVPFGDPASDVNIATTNQNIQEELLTMRPYGSTPVAGLLDDAEEFLFYDNTVVPTQTYRFGPSDDQYWINGCRKTFVVLLSDGQPNMDLRSPGGGVAGCDSTASPTTLNGVCPYDTSDEIAKRLRTGHPTNQSVSTFVVGFTISDFSDMNPVPSVPSGATKCEDLDVSAAGTDCTNPPPQLRGCCNLQKIAVAGGTSHAYFADTPNKLKQALAAILSQVVAGTTDRTWPVYAPAGNRLALGPNFQANPSASYQFAASFQVNASASAAHNSTVGSLIPSLWTGKLVRERTACPTSNPVPTVQPVNVSYGDDFAYNVDMADSTHPRKFLTAIGEADNHNKINSDYSMRPYIVNDDGLGTYKTDPSAPTTPLPSSTFVSQIQPFPAAFGMPSDPSCKAAFGNSVSATQCAVDIVQWEIGLNNALPSNVPFVTRDWRQCSIPCAGPNRADQTGSGCPCSQFGAVFHSTPAVVGPPREFLRDDSYITYQNTQSVAEQPTMLYTATMDGQLHAFKVQAGTPNDTATTDSGNNNELWSFMPPVVLKKLLPNYNTGGVSLLDGAPVIADVPGTLYNSAQAPQFGRTGTSPVTWHRVLLASGGSAGGFYYALDITDPTAPRFLWQLSTDDQGNPLFGSSTPTPAIAIVNVKVNNVIQQIPVAIMPGGATNARETTCHHHDVTTSPINTSYSNVSTTDTSNPHLLSGVPTTAPILQCWKKTKDSSQSSANSLVVARLDTGEVLGFFIGDDYSGAPKYGDGGDDGHGGDNHDDKHNHFHNVFDAPFQSPLTGVPVVYPGQTGEVSDRVYVGDADGLLWRLDMSDPNLSNWKVTLAWDAYIGDNTTPTSGTSLRESIGVVPIVSRDPIGNPVILVATGDQDQFNAQPTTNHVWSLTENPLTKKISPNWHIKMPKGGARVTGPMALFNGGLYFATYLPQTMNVCSDGYGSVWAVDFLRRGVSSGSPNTPAGMTPVTTDWPLPLFPTLTPGAYDYGANGAARTVIMGVAAAETPTCDSTTITPDPYFGSHTALSGVSGSSYQITWQTGAGNGLSTTNTAVKNGNVNGVQYIQAPSPGTGTRIDSWASIVD